MPKRDKKILKAQKAKKKEAFLRKKEAQSKLGDLGITLDDDLFSIGVVLDSLSMSHLNFFCTQNINYVCDNYVGLDLTIFLQQDSPPCTAMLCSSFHISDLMSVDYPLIATSTSSCLDALSSHAPLVCHYAFDMDFIGEQETPIGDIIKAFKDPRVVVVCRCEDHKRLVEDEFGIRVHNKIVPDFRLTDLVKIIIEREKNVNR